MFKNFTPLDKIRLIRVTIIFVISFIILITCHVVSAQYPHVPITIDAKVQRIPVNYFEYEEKIPTLSSAIDRIHTSHERITIVFVNGYDAVLLFAGPDTLELIRIGYKHDKIIFADKHHNNQKYVIYAKHYKDGNLSFQIIPLPRKELYTFRSQSYEPVQVNIYDVPHLYSINIESL